MKRLTYQEIAKESGLSIATISRVITSPGNVSSVALEKVISAIVALGHDPAEFGIEDERKIILFNTPRLSNPFYFPIVNAARSIADSRGYILLMNEMDLSKENCGSFLRMLSSVHAAGVIISNALDKETADIIYKAVPSVMCSEAAEGSAMPYVMIDNENAAYSAVKYLISIGCRNVAIIDGPRSYRYAEDRYKGYCKALEAYSIAFKAEYTAVLDSYMDFEMAAAKIRNMLSSPEPPEAFFCISDLLAVLVVHIAREYGYSVPEDISVIGFDDIDVAKMATPSITTIRQPVSQMGTLAAEMVIRKIEKNEEHIGSILLDTELVIRNSTRK